MNDSVVHTRGLSRRFGRRWALSRVDLDVAPGERLLVVGQNGSGKTTLLRILSTVGLPSRGELRLFGQDPARDLDGVRSRLALLSHLPSLYEDLSGRENLRIISRLTGRPDRSSQWLARVGLDERPDPVHTYSAGMRKRLSFARMLAQEPELALIDEPYGQLDPDGFRFVDALVRELAGAGVTVVMASHLVERACGLCDRALLLYEGVPRWAGMAADAPRAWRAMGRAVA